jgi:hypothetical protein
MLVLDPLSDGINRGIHKLIEVDGILRHLLMVVINSLNGQWVMFVRRINDRVLGLLYGFFQSLLKLLHLLLLGPQLIVELYVLSLLLSELLLNNNNLLFHKPSLLVAHALFLQLLDLVCKLLSARGQLFLL